MKAVNNVTNVRRGIILIGCVLFRHFAISIKLTLVGCGRDGTGAGWTNGT